MQGQDDCSEVVAEHYLILPRMYFMGKKKKNYYLIYNAGDTILFL